jgi:hypothetical protein
MMSGDYQSRMEELEWRIDQFIQAKGVCSCGDSTILGVIHADNKPCSLPTVHLPMTEDQIRDIGVEFADVGGDIGNHSWVEFVRAIEKAHGIGGINEV